MEINEFRNMMVSLSKGLRKWAPDFSDEATVRIWYPSFMDISFEELKAACRLAIDSLKEFPSVKELKELCNGNILDDIEVGQDIASRIEKSVGSYGYTNPQLAKDYIGGLGWEVVKACGGWNEICNIEYDRMSSAKKQWREQGTLLWKKHRAYGMDNPLSIPEKTSTELRSALSLISHVGKVN